jgi:pilus assembly protein CpaC
MLEVKIAEVGKTLLDKLGASVNLSRNASSGLNTYSLASNFLSNGGGVFQALRIGRGNITIDAEKNDGLVRILAEPNIMAISGQSASFLSGGKIFIPVSQEVNAATGAARTTLEEKEFGVGLKFTPTVLDGRINLKVVSEVSELSQTGSPFSTINGVTAIIPSMSTRRVDTTVQLADGQSFVVAGLIKNNVTEALNRIPGLGEVPVMGALFRSTEFQTDQTELMFVVTPRLVKPLNSAAMLPTDNHIVPSRVDVQLMGRAEGTAPTPARAATAEAVPLPAAQLASPATAPAPQVPQAPQAPTPVETGNATSVPEPIPPEATPTAVRSPDIEPKPVSPYVPVSTRP